MIYDYIDTNEHQSETYLPAEAVSINGTYLETIIEGYRTLYVKGRESLAQELNTYTVGVADGERLKGTRYPAREIVIGFQLLCPTNEDFRIRFNQINNILSLDEADFIFNDEADKYFTGTPVMDADVEAGTNNVTGEWRIMCLFPFKRSILPIVRSSLDAEGVVVSGNSATFTFDYNGAVPSRPLLRAKFASAKEGGDYNEDGDCGYVAFLDQEENIIQLGNPEVLDVDQYHKNSTLANSEFDALTDWTAEGIATGNITDPYWDRGQGQTLSYAKGVGTLARTTAGAVDFDVQLVHRLAVNANAQTGAFKCYLQDSNSVVVGFSIEKTGSGTNATVKYILNDKVVGTDNIDVSYYNTNFGYCNRTPVYVTQKYQTTQVVTVKKKGKKKKQTKKVWKTRQVQSGWNYTQANLNSSISKEAGVVVFKIGNLISRTFKDSDIENTPATDVYLQTEGTFNTNAVRSVAFIAKAGVPFAEIPNVFTAGDIVEADCSDANVYLYRDGSIEGALMPQYGALGNDWENFEIKAGQNIIRAVWSDWVDENYKPTIELVYNEVYI